MLGIVMGLDRLIQDGKSSEIRGHPELEFGEEAFVRYFDPVDL